ncbi:hypothetical protein BOTBODRAFT_608781 [Botryobasidium botryosum FD-172 SS1]|uniref:Uncharacterized protein n=1 Tax=Botryobasidium botryosum (strain FD-172 SS1) TaxID=930990 RepID=A0A067M6H6_BOTB1|nr:hypothetical protein BOTBODRAFT_608781 [Botryobasidium botryosum FD-172 SS1]
MYCISGKLLGSSCIFIAITTFLTPLLSPTPITFEPTPPLPELERSRKACRSIQLSNSLIDRSRPSFIRFYLLFNSTPKLIRLFKYPISIIEHFTSLLLL